MKTIVRESTFETNSSSSHALVIMTDKQLDSIGKKKILVSGYPCEYLLAAYPTEYDKLGSFFNQCGYSTFKTWNEYTNYLHNTIGGYAKKLDKEDIAGLKQNENAYLLYWNQDAPTRTVKYKVNKVSEESWKIFKEANTNVNRYVDLLGVWNRKTLEFKLVKTPKDKNGAVNFFRKYWSKEEADYLISVINSYNITEVIDMVFVLANNTKRSSTRVCLDYYSLYSMMNAVNYNMEVDITKSGKNVYISFIVPVLGK